MGTSDDDASSPVPSEVAKLVPADAFLFVHVPSVSALETKVRALASIADPRMSGMIELSSFFTRDFAIESSFLDRDRPVGFALSLPAKSGEPLATMIVPVKNPELVLTSVKGRTGTYKPVRLGGYIGFSEAPDYTCAQTRNGLTSGVAQADVSVRTDLKKLFAFYQSDIDAGIAKAEHNDKATAQRSSMLNALRGFVRSADALDATINVTGKKIDAQLSYKRSQSADAGSSARPGDLATLASFLPTDHPIVGLIAGSPAELMKSAGAWYGNSSTIAAGRPAGAIAAYLRKVEEIQALTGEAVAASARISKRGLEIVQIVRAKDASDLVTRFRALASDPALTAFGVTSSDAKETKVAGVSVFEQRIKIDPAMFAASEGSKAPNAEAAEQARQAMAAIFGSNGTRLRYAAVGEHFVAMVGGDDTLASELLASVKKGKGELPARFKAAFANDAAAPTCFMEVELRSLAQDLVLLLGDATFFHKAGIRTPVVPKGPAIPITYIGRSDGAMTRSTFSFDVGAAADLFRALKH